MKTVALALCAVLALLPLAGCVTPVNGPDGIGVAIAPVASLPRVQEAEANQQEFNEGLAGAVKDLADKVGDEAAKMKADMALKEKEFKDSVVKAKDEAQIDWTTIILAALGCGTVGAGGVGGIVAYRRKLLNTPAPEPKVS